MIGDHNCSIYGYSSTPAKVESYGNYLGSARQDILKDNVIDIEENVGFGQFDYSTIVERPVAEAHGIVWKVVVDGYDAQDEYEQLPPLGVGKHKFEVYFNRPMNKAKAPFLAMGVRQPYTQTQIAEDGAWNETGDIYTAYLTIKGKDNFDGINTIYVNDAEDNEFFPIPREDRRFRVNVQSAGSLSAGFFGEAGLGRVNLTWENPEENFDDMLGYNLYRAVVNDDQTVSDTVRINEQLLVPEETSFTDYDVTPGTTYQYYYKVMRTNLQENNPSKVIAVTPLTSTPGDANGSASVDVADVITTVNYASGFNPKPFIFEAADMNSDKEIDILDVVGIIRAILSPGTATAALSEPTAEFYVQDGVLYVDASEKIAGIQANVQAAEGTEIQPLKALKGFETAGSWLDRENYIFLAYNLANRTIPAGRHALLNIGDGTLTSLVLSDAQGHNFRLEAGSGAGISSAMAEQTAPQRVRGIYNLMGVKIANDASELKRLPRGIYIVNGQKVVK